MARIDLSSLRARSASAGGTPRTPYTDDYAIGAAGRGLAEIGRGLEAVGDVVTRQALEELDSDAKAAAEGFGFQETYIRSREQALRTRSTAGFRDRTALAYDEAANAYLGTIESGSIRRKVERVLRANRQPYLNDAVRAEESVLTDQASELRQTNAAEAVAGFSYAEREFELLRDNAGADPGETSRLLSEDYRAAVDAHVEGIEDPQVRDAVRRQLLGRLPDVTSRALNTSIKTEASAAMQRADAALGGLYNAVRSDPTRYGSAVGDAEALIDQMPNLTEPEREQLKRAAGEQIAAVRFEGLIDAAKSEQAFDGLDAELDSDAWQHILAPNDFNRLKDQIRVKRAGGQKELQAQTRAALTAAADRLNEGFPVDEATMRDVSEAARASGDVAMIQKAADLTIQNRVFTDYAKVPPRVLGPEIAERRKALTAGTGARRLPPELQTAVAEASGFGASVQFLTGLAFFEYEVHFRPGVGETDYTRGTGNDTTSAVGPYQFTAGTWLEVVRSNPEQFPGIATAAEHVVLNARTDPKMAAVGAALYANQNRGTLRRTLGREPTDFELVVAHFLGSGGAAELLRAYDEKPEARSAALLPEAAKNNPGLFDGMTVAGTLQAIAERSVLRPGNRADQVELEAFEKLQKRIEDGAKQDMMGLADELSIVSVVDLVGEQFSEEAVIERGRQARSVADYYDLPEGDWKPLTLSEVQHIRTVLDNPEAPVDQLLDIAGTLQQLGPRMSRAAYSQIGKEAPIFGFAAGLMATTRDRTAARAVLRGERRLKTAVKPFGDSTDKEIADIFASAAGPALTSITNQQVVLDAARAYLAETQPGRIVRSSDMARAIEAVTGSKLDRVNGRTTLLPAGLTGGVVENFLEAAQPAVFSALSLNGRRPARRDGSLIPIDELEDAELVAVGGGFYQMELDGQLLMTSEETGRGERVVFTFRLDPEAVQTAIREPR